MKRAFWSKYHWLIISTVFLLVGLPAAHATSPEVTARLNDLSITLDHLEKTGQLVRVKTEVDPYLELAGIAKKFEGQEKMVLFEKVKGSNYPVTVGFMWNRDLIANLFDTPREKLPFYVAQAIGDWKKAPMKSVLLPKGPANEVIKKGKDVNLYELPAPVHALKDGGRYLDSSVVVVNDPDTGIPNASIHRCMITGKDRMTFLIDRGRHMEDYFNKMEKQGKPLHITINNGVGLAPWIAAIIPRGAAPGDKVGLAGHLMGAPTRVIKAQTVDTVALADAQFVIEGMLLPNVREPEGPFGEVTGYYAEKDNRWVVKVTAITHRNNPVFHTVLGGKEVYNAVGLTAEAKVFGTVSQAVRGIKAVHLSHGGSGFYHAVIQMDKNMEGLQKHAIMSAFTAFPSLKQVVVVDEDVNIFSAEDVEWAINTRCDPERDIFLIKDAFGHELNPTTSKEGLVTKIGIDATAPFPRPAKYERVKYQEIDLKKYDISGADQQ